MAYLAEPIDSAFGHVTNYKEMKHDPLDLRPAADVIVGAIAEKIRAEEKQAQKEGRKPRPVVVLFGESHTTVTHKMLGQLVIQRLDERSLDPVMGMEFENNAVEQIMDKKLGLEISDQKRGAVSAGDHEGLRTVQSTLGYYKSGFAPESWHNQLTFCLDKGIKVMFNDAARKDRGDHNILDKSEPRTRLLLERYATRWQRYFGINTQKAQGMKLRNIMMAEFCEDVFTREEKKKPQVVVQFCGGSHVFGEIGYSTRHQYKDSLDAQLRARDILTVPVILEHWLSPFDLIPDKAQERFSDSVFIRGLDQKGRYITSPPGSEQALMKQINESSGNEVKLYDLSLIRKACQETVKRLAPEWLSSATDCKEKEKNKGYTASKAVSGYRAGPNHP